MTSFRSSSCWYVWAFVGCWLLWSSPSLADDKAVATKLFQEGRALMSEGKPTEACQKFEASLELDRSAGTALNLALCYEKLGRLASAWARYGEAERIAKDQRRPDHAEAARKYAASLEPKLSYLVLQITDPPPGLTVTYDAEDRPAATWGTELPADPGIHVIVATAPGYVKLEAQVTVPQDQRRTEFDLPALEPLAEPSPPEPGGDKPAIEPEPKPHPVDSDVSREPPPPTHSAVPWVVGGVGAAVLLGGLGSGAVAWSKYGSAKDECRDGTNGCPPSAIDGKDSANTWANVANGLTAAGGVTMVVGVVLLIREKKHGKSAARSFVPVVDEHQVGAVWRGSF